MPHLKILNIKSLLFQTHRKLCDSAHMPFIFQIEALSLKCFPHVLK